MKLNKYIDHTKLGASVLKSDIEKLVNEAIEYDFKSVCINPVWVKYVHQLLQDKNPLTCTVVGFPDGAHTSETKVFETIQALKDGADEIDMVINVSDVKNKNFDKVLDEISQIKKACGKKTLKVILETCFLTEDEIFKVSQISVEAGADFVKTSTGFGTYGARVEDVEVMKRAVGNRCKIKASGSIHSYEFAKKLIDAGAERIGASRSIDIMKGEM